MEKAITNEWAFINASSNHPMWCGCQIRETTANVRDLKVGDVHRSKYGKHREYTYRITKRYIRHNTLMFDAKILDGHLNNHVIGVTHVAQVSFR